MNKNLKGEGSAYDLKFMRIKLKEKYKDRIIISSKDGAADIITLQESVDQILRTFHSEQKGADNANMKSIILKAASKLLKSDINDVISTPNHYPSVDYLNPTENLCYIPSSLQTLLNSLFVGTEKSRKVSSIGQCIIQACRPRSFLAPLQIGLSVQLHHHFRSRHLIETLNSFGYCSSYKETLKFELDYT